MTLFKLPRGYGYVFDAWILGPCEKTAVTSLWQWKGRTRNVWLSVNGVWNVVYYAHRTELWWTWHILGRQQPYPEFSSLQLYWACRYGFSKRPRDRGAHSLYWASVREVQ